MDGKSFYEDGDFYSKTYTFREYRQIIKFWGEDYKK